MSFLGQTYEADALPKGTGNFDPLPAGWYSASITDASVNKTKDGTGQYINVRFDITGPTHEGRVVFGKLNIRNASPKAEEIGHQQLGELIRAIGLASVSDTDQLIGGNLQIKLAVREARTDEKTGQSYDASNDVKGFKALGAAGATAPAFPAKGKAAAPTAPASGKSSPPWAKK